MAEPNVSSPRRVPTWVWAAVAVALAVALVLVALELDERDRPSRSAGGAEDGDVFVVEIEEAERPVLVVECDEGPYEEANARFRRHLGVETAPVTLPGGPLLLSLVPEEIPADYAPLVRSAIEVLERYAPAKVILISHADCLVYDVGGAWTGQTAMVPVAQHADVVKAAQNLRKWLPSTTVEAYSARRDGGRIRYNAVPLPTGGEVRR